MEESHEEFRERLHNQIKQKIDDELYNSRSKICAILRGISKEDLQTVIREMEISSLHQYFTIAEQQEDYEVCQALKEEIEKRSTNK